MESIGDSAKYLCITLKYGGYWAPIKNQVRKKYASGKQKTMKFQKDLLSYQVLKDQFESICPWLKGQNFEVFSHICGTSPKEYMAIKSNVEVMELIEQCSRSGRAEVVVITEDVNEIEICSQDQQMVEDDIMLGYDSTSKMVFNENIEFGVQQELVVGARFHDSMSFKQALRTNSIMNNFGVKIQASNKTRVIAICMHQGCPWRVRASLCKDGQSFEVRRLESTHLCPGVNRAGNRQATVSWVAQEIADIIKRDPDIPPRQINNTLESSYGLSLPYMKLWRSREVARDSLFGSVDESYRWVPALQAELVKRNPGSHIMYTCSKKDHSFKRFFVSFKSLIDGFLVGCRPLIGLDACHLKSKYLGVLLSANSLDGNNGLYTLAFAVAESESKKTWKWFLENLALSIGISVQPLAFISDMEKGLAEAIRVVFPNGEHRVCIRHLWKNLKKNFCRHNNQKVGSLVWSAAGALTKIEYDVRMNELSHVSPEVHNYLLKLPYKWAKSDFLPEIKNHYNTNNMAESFNAWIVDARSKPAVDLLDLIRAKLMEQRVERKLNSSTWRGELVPYAEEYIRDITTRKDQFIIRQSTINKAEVEGRHERHEVDLEIKECTCRGWQISGLLCIHVAAFVGSQKIPLTHIYVHELYSVTRYRMAYESPIATLLGKDQWAPLENELMVSAPKSLRPRGRPKKRRIKNFLENITKKQKNVHKCGRCGQWGHHKTSCKNPLNTIGSSQTDGERIDYNCEPIGNQRFRPKLPIRRVDE